MQPLLRWLVVTSRIRISIEVLPLVALGAVAFAARLPLLSMPPYGDEGLVYYVSRHLWLVPENVHDVLGAYWYHPSYIWFQRPVFYAASWLPAQGGFESFRLFHIAFGSLLAPVASGLLRELRVRPFLAYGAGAALAVLPPVVNWGGHALMDTPAAVLMGMGLWAFERERPALAGLLFLVAVWTKEVVFPFVIVLLGLELFVSWRRKTGGLWPLRLDARRSALFLILPVALLPLLYSVAVGLNLPGGPRQETYIPRLLDQQFVSAWFIPILLLGLLLGRSRRWALLGFAMPAFFLIVHVMFRRGVEGWYAIPSVLLVLVGVAVTLDAACDAAARRSWATRMAPAVAALCVALFLALLTLVPASAAKSAWAQPASDDDIPSLRGIYHYQLQVRDQDAWSAYRKAGFGPGHSVFLVDLDQPYLLHPFADSGANVTVGISDWLDSFPMHTEDYVLTIQRANRTILQDRDTAMNRAIRDVYGDCAVLRNDRFMVLEGSACGDRGDALDAAYMRGRAERGL